MSDGDVVKVLNVAQNTLLYEGGLVSEDLEARICIDSQNKLIKVGGAKAGFEGFGCDLELNLHRSCGVFTCSRDDVKDFMVKLKFDVPSSGNLGLPSLYNLMKIT